MDGEDCSGRDYNSDASSDPFFFADADLRGNHMRNFRNDEYGRQIVEGNIDSTPNLPSSERENRNMQSMFDNQFQDMVVRALRETAASLVGSSSALLHFNGEASIGYPDMNTVEPVPESTWNEVSYRKAEARRNKRPQTMRTSAGDEFDSQENIPLPQNATAEQRTLRTRRLNRWRAKKAKDLTSNRKALKKVPFVIHVDGTCKPRGIHRHTWKAAVRGQCGRLDPTMDNINHHPKHVVDSIWHGLEKEWEFEGFAHKTREMFEKSATKFMRNRKMQLKYKCQKLEEGTKPEDVNDTHWKKIVALTKKSTKNEAVCTWSPSIVKGKKQIPEDDWHKELKFRDVEGSDGDSSKRSLKFQPLPRETIISEDENIDVQIKNLKSQLLQLENSRKAKQQATEVAIKLTQEKGNVSKVQRAAEPMKEKLLPRSVFVDTASTVFSKTTRKNKELMMEGDRVHEIEKVTASPRRIGRGGTAVLEDVSNVNSEQMECSEVISMSAVMEGKQEDIGKGVLMGLAGSKLYRKVIPNGWCSIKVSSYNSIRGSEACPFLSGWKDHVKYKTIRDAEGRIILWPETLLHI